MGRSIRDLVSEEKDIPCSDKNGDIQGGWQKSEMKQNLMELSG